MRRRAARVRSRRSAADDIIAASRHANDLSAERENYITEHLDGPILAHLARHHAPAEDRIRNIARAMNPLIVDYRRPSMSTQIPGTLPTPDVTGPILHLADLTAATPEDIDALGAAMIAFAQVYSDAPTNDVSNTSQWTNITETPYGFIAYNATGTGIVNLSTPWTASSIGAANLRDLLKSISANGARFTHHWA